MFFPKEYGFHINAIIHFIFSCNAIMLKLNCFFVVFKLFLLVMACTDVKIQRPFSDFQDSCYNMIKIQAIKRGENI